MHSRIYQVSEKPITTFADEYRYEDWFVGTHADYVSPVEYQSEDYMSDLKWLQNATEGIKVDLKKGTITVVSKKEYFDDKHDAFKDILEELSDTTLEEFSNSNHSLWSKMYELKATYEDKSSFYIDDNYENLGITPLDNWVRNVEEGKEYYIGTITDYHN